MLIDKEKCLFATLAIVVAIVYFDGASARTAPEFRVTVDTKNFKEIRIPLKLWRKIVSRNYGPSEKIIKPNTKQFQTVNGSMVHEVVVNILVPSDEIDESSEQPVVEEEVLIEPDVNMVDNEVSDEVTEAVEVVEAAEETVEAAAEAAPQTPQEAAAAAAAAQGEDASVLVQTTRFPCSCKNGTCECCARIFQQKGCANLKFLPEEFAFDMRMTMNGNLLAKRILPVNDPPPFCFNPRRAPFMELCAQLTDISIKKENVHACVDLEASVGGFDLFSWNYDCIKFGRQGIATGQKRPGSSSGGFDFFGLFGGGGDDDGGLFDGLLPGSDDDDNDDDEDDDDDDDY